MIIKKAFFTFSKAKYEHLHGDDIPQIAIVGKSNVGKSTFINFICDNKKLARTSKSPGRTRLINYFLVNDNFYLTDLPGYGFANVSQEEKSKWADMIEDYLDKEENLVHIIMLVDIRHELGVNDKLMYNYIVSRNIPFTVIATKSDKISRSQAQNSLRSISTTLKIGLNNVYAVSAITQYGKDKVLDRLEQILTPRTDI
ncbi:MAG: ribosome biogenesis GTP-binding protein YihA/YsxC [Clostridia bacterium]|nr:ribosome biogenesis GTP-binding protein YihA/YsxC [Clostridia bacterium]